MMYIKQGAYLARIALRHPQQLRHFARWRATLASDYLLAAGKPWIVFDAADRLSTRVRPGDRVFEYGSGGSTLFWLGLGARVVSIEHDPAWFARLKPLLDGRDIEYRLVGPEQRAPHTTSDPARWEDYASDDPAYHGMQFRRYVEQIDSFPDAAFDIVLVDGRSRTACLAHAIRKLAPGGMLVLDNAERVYYTERLTTQLAGLRVERYVGLGPCLNWMWQTNIYVK